MTPKLHYVSYTRRKKVNLFVLQVQPWYDNVKNYIGFDITELMKEALAEDSAYDYKFMTGPVFGNEVKRALEIAHTHMNTSNAWIKSVKTRDNEFMGFVDSHMNNAKSSVDFFESIAEFRNKQDMPFKHIYTVDDVDVLDFRPMIGIRGVWKSFRKNHVNINRTYDYGTFFKNQRE